MEFALPTALTAMAVLIVFGVYRRRRTSGGDRQIPVITAGPVTVVLDLADADPSDERIRRIVHEAARRAMVQSRDAGEIVVVSRTGRRLGHFHARRPVPPPARTQPVVFLRPPASRRSAEAAVGLRPEPKVRPGFDAHERPATRHAVVDAFDLPAVVRARVREANDPADVVRAILEAGGRAVDRDRDVIRAGDEIVIVVPERADVMNHDALNQAYLDFLETGVASGVVIAMGAWNPLDVRRREMLEPALRHVDQSAIQRMADAVALGEDPLAFVAGPPVLDAPVVNAPPRRTG